MRSGLRFLGLGWASADAVTGGLILNVFNSGALNKT